ncbi:MAG: DUF3160 domain-containing protein [Sporocytophaga sp.]|nr:DUF3160 domain-containing protein [Sporocytophaga sp.]
MTIFKIFKYSFVLLLLLLGACTQKIENTESKSEAYRLNQPLKTFTPYDEGYPITTEAIDPKASYNQKEYLEYFQDYYKDKKSPPPFNFNVDLSTKSFQELRLLRAEILARHGFLLMDYVSRFHFNATDWYQPVFWDENFQICLSEQEKKFIDKVLSYEQKLYKNNYINKGKLKHANMANVVNWQQFEKLPDVMTEKLATNGFVITKAAHEQLFHVYDQNYYDYTPSFITTDLYLQVLHMHISKEMQTLENKELYGMLGWLLDEQYEKSKQSAASSPSALVKQASSWVQVYYAVALSLLNNKRYEVPADWKNAFDYEYTHIQSAEELDRSDFLGDSIMDYTQFIPRGNYTRSDSLKNYFRCVKWLNSAKIYLDNDINLSRAVVMGYNLSTSENSWKAYNQFFNIIEFLAGEENNLSFMHMKEVLSKYKDSPLVSLLTPNSLQNIRQELYAKDPRKFSAIGVDKETDDFLKRKKLLFTAGHYTFDGEILQRLIEVKEPKRPFPKGLDVFAVMGNETAEDILLNTYKEQDRWSGYTDTLKLLKTKFKNYSDWDNCVYNKQMEAVLSLPQTNTKYPYFMKLPAWQKKNLNTMLASWTELKHDMVLYIEQPSGAEMGNGGEIPPPQKIAYVETNITFWNKCLQLLELNHKMLEQNGISITELTYRNNELIQLGKFLLEISNKQLNNTNLTPAEFDELSYIGGKVEQLTLNIIESREAEMESVHTPERYVAVVTDVYTYKDECLQEGVGMADEIYM